MLKLATLCGQLVGVSLSAGNCPDWLFVPTLGVLVIETFLWGIEQ